MTLFSILFLPCGNGLIHARTHVVKRARWALFPTLNRAFKAFFSKAHGGILTRILFTGPQGQSCGHNPSHVADVQDS